MLSRPKQTVSDPLLMCLESTLTMNEEKSKRDKFSESERCVGVGVVQAGNEFILTSECVSNLCSF